MAVGLLTVVKVAPRGFVIGALAMGPTRARFFGSR